MHNLPAVAHQVGVAATGFMGAQGVGVSAPFPPREYDWSAYAGAHLQTGVEAQFPPQEFDPGFAGRRRRRRRRRGSKRTVNKAAKARLLAKVGQQRGCWYEHTEGGAGVECCPTLGGGYVCLRPMAGASHAPGHTSNNNRNKRNNADAIKNGIAGGFRTLPSQIFGQVLPPKGYAGQAGLAQWRPSGNGAGQVSFTTQPGIGMLHDGSGRKSYVKIQAQQGDQVAVVAAEYTPARFVEDAYLGSMVRPTSPSYPGNNPALRGPTGRTAHGSAQGNRSAHGTMGAMHPPAFPSYPGNTGFMGGAASHDHSHGDEPCCGSCADGGSCEGCDGNCGDACTCK